MNHSEIINKASSVKEAFNKIQLNKHHWEQHTKPLIQRVLNEIKDETNLDWLVETPTPTLVTLSIRDNNQEIASLSFTMTYHGLVSTNVKYTTLNYGPDTESRHFKKISDMVPSFVNQKLVYESIDQFLDIILRACLKMGMWA